MFEQIEYFKQDIFRVLGRNKFRIILLAFSRVFWGLFLYRTERSLYLIVGSKYSYLRVILTPIFNIIQAYSNMDIHYKAKIKGGLIILHPSIGVVVSGLSDIGSNLTLTGGNIIGTKIKGEWGCIKIGDNCNLGANSTIIGPIILANDIKIGASACVVKDCLENNSSLIGVPAKKVKK
jgi:serine acetyltransferase